MTAGLLVILTFGALIGGWTLLSLFGAERSRRLTEIEARRRAAAAVIPILRVPAPPSADAARKMASKKPKPLSARRDGKVS